MSRFKGITGLLDDPLGRLLRGKAFCVGNDHFCSVPVEYDEIR